MKRTKIVALVMGAVAMMIASVAVANQRPRRMQRSQSPKIVKIAKMMIAKGKADQALKIADKLMAMEVKENMASNRRAMKKFSQLKMSGFSIAIRAYIKMGNQSQALAIAQQAIPVAKELKARKAVKKLSRFVKSPDQVLQRRQMMQQKRQERRSQRQAN